ncbi:MAG: hypothetical protein OXC18_04215 [Desulfurellaceae bacterium]|nr:hypothetical protein [Desulfurellaceae bacterium]
MSNTWTLFARFGCLLSFCLVLSQCTPARHTLPPPTPQPRSVTPPPPPPAPPVSAEELLNRFDAFLDRA